jgi:hypothetical protein
MDTLEQTRNSRSIMLAYCVLREVSMFNPIEDNSRKCRKLSLCTQCKLFWKEGCHHTCPRRTVYACYKKKKVTWPFTYFKILTTTEQAIYKKLIGNKLTSSHKHTHRGMHLARRGDWSSLLFNMLYIYIEWILFYSLLERCPGILHL